MTEQFDTFIIFILYLALFIYMARTILQSVQDGWNMVAVFLLFWTIQYLIVPLSMILNDTIFFLDYRVLDLRVESGLDRFYSYKSFAVSSIFLAFFFVGVYSVRQKEASEYILKERTISIFSRDINLLSLIGLFLAFLSLASVFIYASQFGSMHRAIMAADAVRSGHGDEFWISKTYIFVYRFIPFSILSIIIFFLLENNKGFWTKVMLWVALGVTLFSRLALFKSKQAIIELLLLYLFYLSFKNKKSYLFHFSMLFLFAIFFLPALESYLDTGKFVISNPMNVIQSIFNMLSFFNFDQTSLEFALNKNYDFVYFEGFISGLRGKFIPISWLTSITGNSMITNTYFFYNFNEAIVPPGVVAFGYYNLGVIGVIIAGVFSGFLVKKIEYFFINITSNNPKFIILYAFIMTKVFTWVRTGIPKFTFYDTVMVVLFLVIILGYEKRE
ncbi:MAG TPA: oligosaccharide repeat unit polymerase [Campylobacterales bacterium]|nr:oligosaccharide repeat unit polymerase [Campylobacterales bacterium]